MSSSPLPILVVTGLRRESRLAAGPGIVTVCSGGSPTRLRSILGERAPGYRAVISFGIAAGLSRTLTCGDVVLASGVVTLTEHWRAHAGILQRWTRHLSAHSRRVIVADVAGLDIPLLDPSGKAAGHFATGALAGDMESHIAAAYAASHGVPFAGLRTICDTVDRQLPPFVAELLHATGGVDLPRVAREIARQPRQMFGLSRLGWNAMTAFSSLWRCRALLGPELGLTCFGQSFGNVP